jgi:flagellar protein FlbD
MIQLTRFNGKRLIINADLIQMVEHTPDTIVVLSNGEKILVKEPVDVVVQRVIEYQRLVHNPHLPLNTGE